MVIAWDGKRIMHVYEGKDIDKHEGTCTCVGKDETAHDSTVGKDEDGYHSAWGEHVINETEVLLTAALSLMMAC